MKLLIGKYNITIILDIIRNIIVIMLLYLFLFNPPFRFMPFGFTKICYLLGLLVIFTPSISKSYFKLFSNITKIYIFFIIYTIFIHVVTLSKASFSYINIFILFESFFTSFVIAYYLVKYYKNNTDKMILWTIIVAASITIYLILFPAVNTYVRDTLLLEQKSNIEHIISFRSFGIADDLLYTYAIVLGIGACFCLQKAKSNFIYYFFFILFLIGIFFNARIGIVPIGIYIIYIVIIERKLLHLLFFSCILVLLFMLLMNSNLGSEYELTINWVVDGFNEIINLFTGEQNDKRGNTDVLATMIVFPETISGFIFGTGKDIFHGKNNSDIGYIIQLYYGGIIYVSFILIIIFSLYIKLLKYNTTNKWFNIVFLGTILLCNIKGYFFFTCSGMRLLMILYFTYILSNKQIISRLDKKQQRLSNL